MRKSILIPMFICGCMTYDPYTGEEKLSNATKGAVIGGALGAIAGNQVKGNRKTRDQAMAAGVLLGASLGGAAGRSADKQESMLRSKLRGSGVSVTRKGNNIVLNMPGNVTFEFGQAAIKDEFFDVLDSVASVILEFKNTNVEIGGHTDNKGNVAVNQTLSQQRANAVAAYFRKKGVSPSRISSVGSGSSNPVASNATEEGRNQNRRVEIFLTPKE